MISQAVICGDRRPYLGALVVPDEEACTAWAAEQGLPAGSWQALAESEVLRKQLQNRINRQLASLNPHEQVRRIAVCHESFTIENGLLTPTMKLKRQPIYNRYAELFSTLYG